MTAPAIKTAAMESWEDHVEAWHHLGRQVDGAAWGRAAIAASLKGRYGESAIVKFAEEVGFGFQSVYRFARTFDAFPEYSHRCETLTFSHHLHAAVLTATAEEARAAVAEAEREGWSANALRSHLRPAPPAVTAEACDTDGGACGPVTPSAKAFHIASLIESLAQSAALFDAAKTYEIDPLVQTGTKKGLRELADKIDPIVEWLLSLKKSIHRRTK